MPKNTVKKRSITDTMFGWGVLGPASLFTIATVVTAIDMNPVVYSPLALPLTLSAMAIGILVFTAIAMFVGSCIGVFSGLFSNTSKQKGSSNSAKSTPDNSNTATQNPNPLITPLRTTQKALGANPIAAARTADDTVLSTPRRAFARVFT